MNFVHPVFACVICGPSFPFSCVWSIRILPVGRSSTAATDSGGTGVGSHSTGVLCGGCSAWQWARHSSTVSAAEASDGAAAEGNSWVGRARSPPHSRAATPFGGHAHDRRATARATVGRMSSCDWSGGCCDGGQGADRCRRSVCPLFSPAARLLPPAAARPSVHSARRHVHDPCRPRRLALCAHAATHCHPFHPSVHTEQGTHQRADSGRGLQCCCLNVAHGRGRMSR